MCPFSVFFFFFTAECSSSGIFDWNCWGNVWDERTRWQEEGTEVGVRGSWRRVRAQGNDHCKHMLPPQATNGSSVGCEVFHRVQLPAVFYWNMITDNSLLCVAGFYWSRENGLWSTDNEEKSRWKCGYLCKRDRVEKLHTLRVILFWGCWASVVPGEFERLFITAV